MAGSTLPVSLFLGWPSVSRPVRSGGRGTGSRRWWEGVAGTWSTKGAVESHSDKAPAGVEAEGSLTAHGLDRDKLGHGGCQEL